MDLTAAPRALLFDKDGTLFGFTESWGPFTVDFLHEVTDGDAGRARVLGQRIGFDLDTGTFAPDSPVIAGTEVETARVLAAAGAGTIEDLAARMQARAADAKPVPAVDLAPLLATLRGLGLTLGVMTNDAEAAAQAHLAQQGVLDAFAFVAGYDSGFGAKPEPGPLLAFAEATGIAPGDIAMVGDSTHDLMAARAAGMRGIGVLTGPAEEAVLTPLAEVVLPDIGHLPRWLAGLRAA